ncbi:MAG: AlpA family phage regulatory protein [Photobacterium frigidiphilum]|uniref:AlpA family phage regulatory protein n=1 Tax=Photobacterium frigidiphilum TaxID=264736 RepID=UPI0030030B98
MDLSHEDHSYRRKSQKLKEVIEKKALSRSAIYRKMEAGEFPVSVSLGDRAVAWVESEIDGRTVGYTYSVMNI